MAIARAVAKTLKFSFVMSQREPWITRRVSKYWGFYRICLEKKGATVIIVTHNGALAPIADRVIRMHDAKVKSVEINELPQDIATLEY